MALRLAEVDRDTPMLLPPDPREWVPSDHIAHFIVEAATYSDVVARYICGADRHPDHDTICEFRRGNRRVIEETFVKVLMLAREQKQLKRIGTVAIDGSKILANASKHAAVSYERAGEQIEFLEEEARRLMAKAEEADTRPLEEGLSLPEEIRRREDRKTRLEQAREIIEKRFQAHQREKEAARESREDDEPKRRRRGRKRKTTPDGTMQYNFTDPDSRIMKAGSGEHFEQAYNAQAAVDTGSMLIVGARVSQKPNDKQELEPTLGSIDCGVMKAKKVLVDSGFYSEEAIGRVEADGKVEVLAAVEKSHHGMTVDDLEKKQEPREPAADAPMKEKTVQSALCRRGLAFGHGIERGQMLIEQVRKGYCRRRRR